MHGQTLENRDRITYVPDNLPPGSPPRHYRITQTNFTWEQYIQNPATVIDVYAALNNIGLGYFRRQINHNIVMRNDRLTTPSPPTPPPLNIQIDG